MLAIVFYLSDPFGADIAFGPVAAFQAVYADTAAARRADEVAVADVNTRVGHARLICRKENQIARYELVFPYAEPHAVLLVSHARQFNAVVGKDVFRKAGAIEALRRIAAEHIGHADVLVRRIDELMADVVGALEAFQLRILQLGRLVGLLALAF